MELWNKTYKWLYHFSFSNLPFSYDCLSLEQGTTKINLAINKLPQFQCCKLSHPDPGPQHVGTIHIGSERYDAVWLICCFDLRVFLVHTFVRLTFWWVGNICLSVRSLLLEGQTWLERKYGLEIVVTFGLIERLLLPYCWWEHQESKSKWINLLLNLLRRGFTTQYYMITFILNFPLILFNWYQLWENRTPKHQIPWQLCHCTPAFKFHLNFNIIKNHLVNDICNSEIWFWDREFQDSSFSSYI